jgi:HKD family nuclease
MSDLVPSNRQASGFEALEYALAGARSISAAVAFVTESGVDSLAELMEPLGEVELEVVARAGGVTTPASLNALRERLGAQVSVVIGHNSSRFHPKLWLVRGEANLTVLSGSGNLTRAGLQDNDEQFELSRMPLEGEAAGEQEERFISLTAGAHSLEAIEGTVVWSAWLTAIKKSAHLRKEIQRLEAELNAVPVKLRPEAEREELLNDLSAIHAATVAKDMITPKGKLYRPNRFLAGINRARDQGDPFDLVRRLCRRQTEGFDIILKYDEPLLTVESLVVDEGKSYHHLFTEQTRELAVQRLRKFPSWKG